ncbi:MAG TPA: VOC family protein [Micromonosporaceae bacterium]|jgi:catechol 2,3-dioxygenase-like lactoylglutathione lyase family enzyme|nr:VOC family protein [Micromonosporaceae bacterium]
MKPLSLWVPFEVADLDAARRFYTVQLGLSEVDAWGRDGERGVVLRVPGPAHVELVQPARGAAVAPAAALALELAGTVAVDRAAATLDSAAPTRFPRGHYGFTVRDPDGVPVLVWSER